MGQEQNHTLESLSMPQRKVVFLMENLRPYERIEIKMEDDGSVSVTSTHTTKERFPKP